MQRGPCESTSEDKFERSLYLEAMSATSAFARFVLRTTDAVAARAFYSAVLKDLLVPIVPLHEQAIARGARAHWLGQIEVDDVEKSAQAFMALGAQALNPQGPFGTFPDGRRFAVLRDPGGALVGLTSTGSTAEPRLVHWHHLHTSDLERVTAAYSTLFGWTFDGVTPTEHGALNHFGWSGEADAGAFTDIRGFEGRHAHWLFHFHVSDFDRAVASVRALNGKVVGPFELPRGERVAVCDDPQGAAFAIRG